VSWVRVNKPNYDSGDWRLHPILFHTVKTLWLKSGHRPFQVDAACDVNGYNSHVPNGIYCSKQHSFMASDLSGKSIYANPDWRLIPQYIQH